MTFVKSFAVLAAALLLTGCYRHYPAPPPHYYNYHGDYYHGKHYHGDFCPPGQAKKGRC